MSCIVERRWRCRIGSEMAEVFSRCIFLCRAAASSVALHHLRRRRLSHSTRHTMRLFQPSSVDETEIFVVAVLNN